MTEPAATTPRVCDAAPTHQGERCPMGGSLRERVLAIARGELGVREDAGANRNHAGRIAGYLAPCVRGGKRLGLTAAAWCAGFVSWCVWTAWTDPSITPADAFDIAEDWSVETPEHRELHDHYEHPPIGYRASVAELCADARATGTLRLPGEHLMPDFGDVLIFGRDGGNPLHGGLGHAGFNVPQPDGALVMGDEPVWVCAGNQSDAVTIQPRAFGDVLAWIALGD